MGALKVENIVRADVVIVLDADVFGAESMSIDDVLFPAYCATIIDLIFG